MADLETGTEVLIQKNDLAACELGRAEGEVAFSGRSLRDFAKLADLNAKDLDSLGIACGATLLELRFGPESPSIVCRVVSPGPSLSSAKHVAPHLIMFA